MKLFILAALLATASASVTSAEVRLNDNTGAFVAAIRYNSVDRLVVADLTVPGQAQANTAEVSDFLAKFHGELDQLIDSAIKQINQEAQSRHDVTISKSVLIAEEK